MDLIGRAIGVGVGFAAGKLAKTTGIEVDPATQASVTVAVYALVHRLFKRFTSKESR